MRKYDFALREMRGPSPNIEMVLGLLSAAIEAGDHRAQYALATWYLHGTNLSKNLQKAVALLVLAAGKGNRNAMYDLAVCYEKGAGTEKDTRRAFNYYVSAALRGDKQSQFEVGRMLYHGIGTVEDRGLADLWLSRARKLGIESTNNDAEDNGGAE